MDTGVTLGIVGAVVVVLVAVGVWLWLADRSLLALQSRVDDAWGAVEGQLGRRAELVPTIVASVGRYAAHEKSVLARVSDARSETEHASDASSASVAEGHMQKALKGVFTVAEGYPQLQGSQEFLQLQSELVATEDRIQAARRSYNGGVRELNTKARSFPASTFAKRRGIGQAAFFETTEPAAIAEPPRVQF